MFVYLGRNGQLVDEKRFVWIDIAKGVAILLVIAGHLYPFGSLVRNIIYSFHMPIFFILTGYTIKVNGDEKQLLSRTLRDLKKIIVPYLLTTSIIKVLEMMYFNGQDPVTTMSNILPRLWFASGVSYQGYAALGMLWFLPTLFWSKLLFRLVNYKFPKKEDNLVIFLFLTILGLVISHHRWLPQNFDIVLVSTLFVCFGYLLKESKWLFNKYYMLTLVISFSFWCFVWQKGTFIELATRSYPQFALSFLGAIAGSISVFYLSKTMGEIQILKTVGTFLGRNSLIILLVHSVDYIWFSKGPLQGVQMIESHIAKTVVYIAVDVAITFIVITVINQLKKLKKLKK